MQFLKRRLRESRRVKFILLFIDVHKYKLLLCVKWN